MIKSEINTDKAPKAVGPYSQAVKVEKTIYCSGQIPIDPETGDLIKGNIEEQALTILQNLEKILIEAGTDINGIVKTTIFLKDLSNFSIINKIYGSYFIEPYPARVTVGVKDLPLGVDIEIDAIAVLEQKPAMRQISSSDRFLF